MKSFLVKNKVPIVKWGLIPNNCFFEGTVPEGYKLAISPSEGYVIIDIDNHGDICGFDNIPENIMLEINQTLNYKTKNNGLHAWFKYTGAKVLANKASGLGIDLRTHKGYVVWNKDEDIRNCMYLIKPTSLEMNSFLEKLFSYMRNDE